MLVELIRQHTEDDRIRFESIEAHMRGMSENIGSLVESRDAAKATLDKIDRNVLSLIDSRAYARGVSKAVYIVAGLVATIVGGGVSGLIAWAIRVSH